MASPLFVFPGQGSQALGMLADIAQNQPQILDTFTEASDALGYDLWQLCQQGPAEKLNQTENTQPAILTASIAIYRLVKNHLAKPKFMAGHSLGEYSALVAAGVIKFSDAVRLVRSRGQYMQAAVPNGTGAMAAIIGLDDVKINKACSSSANGQVVEAVNYNSPGQVVIAGHKEAVERAMIQCKELGAKRALPLPVSVPSHCALMKPAAEKLAEDLSRLSFQAPSIPVINNVHAEITSKPGAIKEALRLQLFSPIRWTETIQFADNHNVDEYYECGPGKVLIGLTKRIIKGASSFHLGDVSGLAKVNL